MRLGDATRLRKVEGSERVRVYVVDGEHGVGGGGARQREEHADLGAVAVDADGLDGGVLGYALRLRVDLLTTRRPVALGRPTARAVRLYFTQHVVAQREA